MLDQRNSLKTLP